MCMNCRMEENGGKEPKYRSGTFVLVDDRQTGEKGRLGVVVGMSRPGQAVVLVDTKFDKRVDGKDFYNTEIFGVMEDDLQPTDRKDEELLKNAKGWVRTELEIFDINPTKYTLGRIMQGEPNFASFLDRSFVEVDMVQDDATKTFFSNLEKINLN